MGTQDVLDKIVNGVAVVASKRGNVINGCSIAWVSQVNFDPPLVMVCMGKTYYTTELIEASKVFGVSLLAERQVDVARLFGNKSGREVNKFSTVAYETKETGAPILKDCLAYMDCRVHSSFDVGVQRIYVGEIVAAELKKDEKPLIYNPKDYH